MIKFRKKEKQKKELDKEFYENWQVRREKGKKSFVLKYGVISWAGSTFLLYWLIIMIIGWISDAPQSLMPIPFILSIIIFAIFGVIYGLMLWNRNEKIYLKRYPYRK